MDEKWMQQAIELAKKSLEANDAQGGPFGAVIVKDGKVIGSGYNQVVALKDPTAHAEMQAIRDACKTIDDFDLSECELYTSCEPCPMCLSAIYWARITKVYYAGTSKDAERIGFIDQFIFDELAKDIHDRNITDEQLLRDDAVKVMQSWFKSKHKIEY